MKLNFEAPPGIKKMNVFIKVTDSGTPPLSTLQTLIVIAEDVNEPPSNITILGKNEIYENAALEIHFAQLWAENPEGFKQDLTYTIEPLSQYFEIQKTHGPAGHSFLALKKELDFDYVKKITLKLKVEDNGQPQLSARGEVTIEVLRNDPCITGSFKCSEKKTECSRKSKNEYTCECVAGYEKFGGKCVPIDECRPTCDNCEFLAVREMCKRNETEPCGPCVNEGTCVDHHNNYTCNCKPGYTGKDCYTDINECASSPCKHGTCIDKLNGFTCDCLDSGFQGEFCNKAVNECLEKPCFDQSNQPCTDLVGGFMCNCSDFMSGTRCERKMCPQNSECTQDDICHSVDLTKALATSKVYRCISKDKLSYLEFETSFAPIAGVGMDIWKEKFEMFLRNDVRIPLGWLKSGGEGASKVTDIAIYQYLDSAKRVRRDDVLVKRNSTTSVTFYALHEETVLTPAIMMYSINNVCERNIYCSKVRYNQFKCEVCRQVNSSLLLLNRPVVLASTGSDDNDDPEWMNIAPIIGIVMVVLLATTLVIYMYRRRTRNQMTFKNRSDDFDVKEMKVRDTIEIRERRSRSENEDEFDHFSGVINPMYGADEDELENNVVNTLYRKKNPDGTVRVRNKNITVVEDEQNNTARMFDNPLFGKDVKDDPTDSNDDWASNGFSNPNFAKPESQF